VHVHILVYNFAGTTTPLLFTISITCIMIELIQRDQQMHILHYNYDNVLIRKFVHVSDLTGPSSVSSTVHTLESTGCSNSCAHIHLYTHTLKNL
jgi:hypothetical protein